MNFFIPFAKDEEEANSVIKSISEFTGFSIPLSKIYSIHYKHNGISMSATIGENPDKYYFEVGPVIAILKKPGLYAICTPNRGVIRGEPILVGSSSVQRVIYFDQS